MVIFSMTISTTPTPKNCTTVLTMLHENIVHLTQLLANIPEEIANSQPTPHDWSLAQVIAHLRSSADLNQFKIFAMLATDTPHIPAIHPRLEWQKIVPYTQRRLAQSLMAYQLQREELLIVLRGLDEAGWNRGGVWDGRSYTIYLVARSMALHERDHFMQIEALLPK